MDLEMKLTGFEFQITTRSLSGQSLKITPTQCNYMDDPSTSAVEGFGLMDYNARWYDPSLGRFAQADSIVPGGAQGLDRYAYVNNAPTRFTDPSGHKCAGDDAVLCSPASLLHISSNPDRPDDIDPNLRKNDGRIDTLYRMYKEMWANKDDWWWDRYGSGGFTIWEFMAIIWGYEQAGYPNTDKFVSALSNKAGFWCHVRNCDPFTAEGSMIFLSRYSQSARNRIAAYGNGKAIDELFYKPPAYWANDTMKIVMGIQQSTYAGHLAPMALFDVGNVSLRSEIFRRMINLNMIHIVWGDSKDDRLVILTYCQSLMVNYAIFKRRGKAINQRTYNNFCGG
ncbi:RHS repeat-associated core domain-containing protein [Candidatus Woesearchaeota archaeon]|nr:RHS repeat-associated core domain-containing protein [Candidatus Woesearchaeota archaeon]